MQGLELTLGTRIDNISLFDFRRAFFGRGKIPLRAVGVVVGSVVFRLVYTIALRFNIPAYMLKLVSSVIVIIAISGPYLRRQLPIVIKRIRAGREGA